MSESLAENENRMALYLNLAARQRQWLLRVYLHDSEGQGDDHSGHSRQSKQQEWWWGTNNKASVARA